MINSARICTIVFGSMPFTAAWEIAAYAGAHAAGDAQPPTLVIAAGGVPQIVAALAVATILAAGRRESAPQPVGAPPTARQVRRAAIEAVRPRELTR